MKMMWCWRCKTEVPMLDEAEFAVVNELYGKGFKMSKEFRQEHNLPFGNCSIDERFQPMREKYREMTGYEETNQLAILHHRISIYGEPCKNCGKPLRTLKADFCAACGEIKG